MAINRNNLISASKIGIFANYLSIDEEARITTTGKGCQAYNVYHINLIQIKFLFERVQAREPKYSSLKVNVGDQEVHMVVFLGSDFHQLP
jgi:hypothetical protein